MKLRSSRDTPIKKRDGFKRSSLKPINYKDVSSSDTSDDDSQDTISQCMVNNKNSYDQSTQAEKYQKSDVGSKKNCNEFQKKNSNFLLTQASKNDQRLRVKLENNNDKELPTSSSMDESSSDSFSLRLEESDNSIIVISDESEGEAASNASRAKKDDSEGIPNLSDDIFMTLMDKKSLKDHWNEEKDKHLIKYILDNMYSNKFDFTYEKLLQKKSFIFEGATPEILKRRAESLMSASKFVYLQQLCGGEKIVTECQKNQFVKKIEDLRKWMVEISTRT